MGLFLLVALTGFNVLRSGLLLSSANVGINVSSFKGRAMIDQIGEASRYALAQPTLVDATGAAVAGSTADGLLVKRFEGTPYSIFASDGTTTTAIKTTDTQFVVKYRNTLPAPAAGHFMLFETISRPELEIASVTTPTLSGSLYSCKITTTTAIGDSATPSSYRVTGDMYHKEAFIFVATDATRFDLRHFDLVTGSTLYATDTSASAPYHNLANGFQRLNNQSFFTNGTGASGTAMTSLAAMAYSSSKSEYIAGKHTNSTFTSVPMQVRLWSLNN